ncbi:MAG: chorismate-binding protein, partial [Candidatus Sericytochromatia bacterium]
MKKLADKPKIMQKNNQLINLKAFFNTAIKNNLPVAIWHSPNENKSYAITSVSGIETNSIDFNSFQGFVFSPFSNKESYLIKNDIIIDENGIYQLNNDKSYDFIEQYKNNEFSNEFFYKNINNNDINYEKDEYISLVSKAINFIKSGKAQKVVTSRTKKINLDNNFDIFDIFNSLVNKYNNAFVSLVSIPQIGTWIGASPEILLKIQDNSLTTMSLA